MIFSEQDLMLLLIMPDGTADSVINVFDWLTDALGLETFRVLFPVLLTDNGSEFKRALDLECTWDGQQRTRVFYCDPQASWQKPHIEKNHEFIRYVIQKGKTLNPYCQEDMAVLMSHINSTKRAKLKGKAPIELAVSPAFEKLKQVLNIRRIPADEVSLTPKLLRRQEF
jgi:IS30 family transposase